MRPYVIADVFTDVPLQGNPVAVFTDAHGLGGEIMQRAARELNLSETVFVLPPGEGFDARLRIFTPRVELPFAGHPVLGAAFILGERSGADHVRLQTGSGVISVALERHGGTIVFGEMQQPIPTWEPFALVDELLAALGAEQPELPVEVYDNGPRHVFVEIGDEGAVAALTPDMIALSALGEFGFSCFSVGEYRVKTRMFGPSLGVAEDPATGSAAGPLAVHLARYGRTEFDRRIEIRQGAEIGRPSTLFASAHGSAERLERVMVAGGAVVVAHGKYRLD